MLFISYQKPHKAVSKDSIARWCKEVMTNAGIDMTSFVSHSSRSAASSYAHAKGASLKDICAACGWATEKTFALHYKKFREAVIASCMGCFLNRMFPKCWSSRMSICQNVLLLIQLFSLFKT